MADLSREDVLKLARLARLEVTDEEVEKFQVELTSILQYVDQIQKADVRDVEPTTQVTGLKNVMREDEVIDYGITADDLLKIAPKTEGRQLKTGRMIGGV